MTFPVDKAASRSGQFDSEGNSRELYVKLFSGEVLTAFHDTNLALSLTRVKTISSGKSYSFPLLGRTKATYHKPGQLIDANKIPHTERLVSIDDIAISPVFVADIDEAIAHYDSRAPYSDECGEALGDMVDRKCFRTIAQAALITSKSLATAAGLKALDDEPYTSNIQLGSAGDEDNGAKLVDAIYKARTQFKLAKIKEQPVVVFPPEQYEALINVNDVTKVAWINKDTGGAGSVSEGSIARIAGMTIYETNNLPQEDESSALADNEATPLTIAEGGSGNEAKYLGDYSAIVGLVFSMSAMATVKLIDVTTKVVDEPLRLGSTILGKLAVGHDVLRPCCAVAILKSA
jgi:hypothetical protein